MGSTKDDWAEVALEETATQLQGILDYSPFIIFMRDTGGTYLLMNRQAEGAYGITVEDVLGKTNYDLFPKEMADRTHKEDQELIKTKKTIEVEETLDLKGKERTFLTTKFPILDENGEVYAVCGISVDITARKKAEEALQESEERLRKFMDSTTDGFSILDSRLNFIDVDKTMETHLGMPRGEIIGKNIADIIPDIKKTGRYDEYMEVMKTGKPFSVDDVVSHPKLGDIHIGVKAFKVGGGLGILSADITERKNAEAELKRYREDLEEMVVERTSDLKKANEALRESETRYRGLFEDSPISLWEEDFSEVKKRIDSLRAKGVKDFEKYFKDRPKAVADFGPTVKVVDVNKATLKLYKAKSKKELLRGLDAVFGKESYDTFREELIAIAEGKTVFESETIERTLPGKKIHVALRWSVAQGYEETLAKVLVSISDITERKLAEEEKNRLFKAIAASSEGIAITDEKDRYTYVNEAHAKIYGYSSEELIGKTFRDLMPSEALAQHEAGPDTLHDKDIGRVVGEFNALRKDGAIILVYVTATALCDENGDYSGHICHVTDITERKNAEEKLKQKMEDLEKINKFMVGRELRMKELKKRIKELEARIARLE